MSPLIDIIDDDEAVRDSTGALLEACGYAVRAHASAEAFLTRHGPNADCLIVDQHMPGMTGIELIEHIRAKGDQTPALMITGRSDSIFESRAASIGLKIMHKPVPENDLIQWISNACRTRV